MLVRALFRHMGEGIQGVHGFYRGVFREIARLRSGLVEGGRSQRARDQALEQLVELFERGQARGDIAGGPTARDLADAFESLTNGTITSWLYEDPSMPLSERMERAAEILLGAVALEERDARKGPWPNVALSEESGDPDDTGGES